MTKTAAQSGMCKNFATIIVNRLTIRQDSRWVFMGFEGLGDLMQFALLKSRDCRKRRWQIRVPETQSAFVGVHNEALSVAAMRVCNPDCSPVGINGWDPAQAESGFAEIVSDDFPVLCPINDAIFKPSHGNDNVI
jgi:hypothetical protein